MYEPRRAFTPAATTVPDHPVRALDDASVASASRRGPKRAVRFAAPFVRRVAIVGGVSLATVALAAAALPQAMGASGDSAVPRALAAYDIAPSAVGGLLDAPTAATGTTLVSVSRAYSMQPETTLRAKADAGAETVATIPFGTQVWVTDQTSGDFRKVEFGEESGWVLASSLVKENAEEAAGVTLAPCSRGSSIEKKLRPKTIEIYRSVCALFPDVNSYGGWRSGGLPFHKNGRALDIMLTPYKESALGHRIADYLIAHAREFNVDHIIFEQHIWTPSTPHWRKMGDRGGITANHFNHVHVAIKG